MRKLRAGGIAVIALGLFLAVWLIPFTAIAEKTYNYFVDNDPDMPGFLQKSKAGISKEEYMRLRSEQVALYRGMQDGDPEENIESRNAAIAGMEKQEEKLKALPSSPERNSLLAAWTPIGPDPIPNGQTVGVTTPVSGRVTAIDVHPTNPNIVYVGTAMGGVYRSIDGGVNWTPLLDNALSLAVGAVTIAPSQPDTVYVGTGEGNFSADSYFGVGVYRIDNASTTATLSEPLGGSSFNGRGISEILVHPTDPAIIFVASTSAVSGINAGGGTPAAPNRGIFRSTDATAAAPTFTRLANLTPGFAPSVRDIAIDPLNPNLLVANVVAGSATINGVVTPLGGLYTSTDALAAAPTFTQTLVFNATSTSELTAEFAVQHTDPAVPPTIYAATGNLGGRVLVSTDNGATWTQRVDNDFCTPQCFYNIAIDVDPIDPNRVYLGGGPTNSTMTTGATFAISTTGGTAFVRSEVGLHVDSHAIAVSPSNPNIIYFGSDGGIYRSEDLGLNWVQRNNAGFLATQFMSLDTHPTDPNLSLGGTQDNGTNQFQSNGTWRRADFGDGGYAVIDQSSANNAVFNMYHTYFNASTLTGYAYNNNVGASDSTWSFRGCQTANGTRNGITCTAVILFYAPLERGPSVTGSTGNTIYYGSDRLYRSVDTGVNNATVSQIFTAAVSAIGISPQNDNVRILGLRTGGLFGTSTGATPLVDLDPSNTVPDRYVSRAVIDPANTNTAYVTLTAFDIAQVYRTTNFTSFASEGLTAPTWTAISGASTGLPLVPVNSFIVQANNLYAGTDIGVYASSNGGASWTPFGTGLPRIAVFDLAIAPGNILRAATHGKGVYQIPAIALAPTAATVNVSGRVTARNRGVARARVSITNAAGEVKTASTNALGYYRFTDVVVGETYIFDVKAKRLTFATQVVYVIEDTRNLNFTGD